jgi:hypothetical protein
MTDDQLEKGKKIKSTLTRLNEALEQFKFKNTNGGVVITLPPDKEICDAVKTTIENLIKDYNDKFKNL